MLPNETIHKFIFLVVAYKLPLKVTFTYINREKGIVRERYDITFEFRLLLMSKKN